LVTKLIEGYNRLIGFNFDNTALNSKKYCHVPTAAESDMKALRPEYVDEDKSGPAEGLAELLKECKGV